MTAREQPEDIQRDEPTPQEMATPIIFEGMDETCSICQEAFSHGQRVCRLSCRHMFHTDCWERAQLVANQQGEPRLGCPNCRGAGTLIAVWHYIDPERVTQVIGGLPAPNLLESSATVQGIDTPNAYLTP